MFIVNLNVSLPYLHMMYRVYVRKKNVHGCNWNRCALIDYNRKEIKQVLPAADKHKYKLTADRSLRCGKPKKKVIAITKIPRLLDFPLP